MGLFYENKIEGVVSVMKNGEIAQFKRNGRFGKIARIGSRQKLVAFAEDILEAEKITKIWLNAREKAVPFYEKCGYKIEGEIFIIKPIGFHYYQ